MQDGPAGPAPRPEKGGCFAGLQVWYQGAMVQLSRLRSLSMVLALGGGLALAGVSAAQAAGMKDFRDWTAVCDNLDACVAFAFPKDESEIAWLRLERAGDAGAPVAIVIAIYAEDDPDVGGGPWTILVDGRPVAGLGVLSPVQDGTGFWRAEVPAANGRALALAARDGSALTVSRRGRPPVSLSLSGGAATLLWIDEQQNRLGSPTALSRATGTPSAIVVPPAPVIAAGPAITQTGLPGAVPPSVMKVVGDCEDMADREVQPLIARLAPGVVLFAPVCSLGAYNAVHGLVLADEAGRNPRAISLPLPAGADQASISDPMNLDYDPDTRILASFAKGRGLGDCGDELQWIWDGKAFQVLSMQVMPVCRGVPGDDWPTLYRATVR